MGTEFLFWSDEKNLKLDRGNGGYNSVNILKTIKLYISSR